MKKTAFNSRRIKFTAIRREEKKEEREGKRRWRNSLFAMWSPF